MCRKDFTYIACSPDGNAAIFLPNGEIFIAVIEIKTMTSTGTLRKAQVYAQK